MNTALFGYPENIVERHRARRPVVVIEGTCEVVSVRGLHRPAGAQASDLGTAKGVVAGVIMGLGLWAVAVTVALLLS